MAYKDRTDGNFRIQITKFESRFKGHCIFGEAPKKLRRSDSLDLGAQKYGSFFDLPMPLISDDCHHFSNLICR
jgi:hypothetical protein